jgi:hypothetical protein
LRTAVLKLDGSMTKVSESTARPIFTGADTKPEADKNDIIIVRDAIKATQTDITDAKKKAGELKKYPLSGYFGSYKDAKKLEKQVNDVADKSTSVLTNYTEVVNFIEKMDETQVKFEENSKKLNQLESLTDINKIVAALEDGAKAFTTLASDISTVTTPQDYKQYQTDIASVYTELAAGFSDLAKATKAYDLNAIEAASVKIDAAVAKGDKIDKEFQAKINQDSAFIKSVKALQSAADSLKI